MYNNIEQNLDYLENFEEYAEFAEKIKIMK